MAPTKSAGRVSIRVLPDSTRFREDLKKTLDRIENTMRVKIQVDPVFDRKQLAELKRQIEALKITIRPDIDLSVPTGDIEKIKESIEAMSPMVEINTKVNTAAAAARIRALTRDKMVQIWPIIHKAAVNNFTKHLAAISGASFISKEVQKGMDFLRTIDQHAIQLAKQATLMGGVISLVNGAVQSIMALGDGLISTLGILTVAPALASSMAIAVAVFVVALKDMKTVLADLGPAFTQLAQDMSFKFWDEAAEPIREMVNHLMPTLSEKMLLASTSMGKLTGQIAKSYKEHVTIEKFATMFDRVLESMDTVRGAVDPIIEAFTILGMHGTQYLNRLSLSVVKLSEDFRDWLKVSEENGNLTKWTEDAIQAFKDLGGILKGVWDVFGALNAAMKAAGGPTLSSLHANLDSLARMMDSDMFQRSLTAVFRGMNHALADIGQALIDLGPALASMAPVIELSFVSVGDTISILLGYLGEIMSHPAVRGGLMDLFEGINGAVRALAPAIEPFSLALGSLLTLLGTVVTNVGELVSTIMTEWGPSLQKLSDTFDTLAEPLRIMLEDVVKALTPAIEALIDDAIIPLLEWIRDHLIPAVSDFARDSGPAMVKIAEGIGAAITDHLLPALTILTDLFTDAEGEASGFKKTLDGLEQLINDPEAFMVELPGNYMEFSRGVDNFILDWWDDMMAEAEREMNSGGGNMVGDWFIDLGKGIGQAWDDMWANIDWTPDMDVDLAVSLAEVWQNVEDWWADIENGWNDFWGGFSDRNADMEEMLDEEGLQMATAGIDLDLAELQENFSRWWTEVGEGWSGFWEQFGITSETGTAGLGVNLALWWSDIQLGFATWWNDITTGWDGFWGGLHESVSTWWAGITENLSTWWTGITEGINTWLEGMGVDTETGWSTISSLTQLAWDAMWTWLGERWSEIQLGLKIWLQSMGIDVDGGMNAIKSTVGWIWDQIKLVLAGQWEEMIGNVRMKVLEFAGAVGQGFRDAADRARERMQELVDGVEQGVEDAVNWVRGLPGRIAEAIANTDLYAAGQTLMGGFRDGIASMGDAVAEAGRTALDRLRGLFPASPAKWGPFSGTGWTPYSGAALMDGFAEGMQSRMASTVKVAHTMSSGVGKELSNVKYNPAEVATEQGHEGSNGNVTVKIYNPIAEPSSRTIARASSMIKLGGKV